MYEPELILKLAEAYAKHERRSLKTVGQRAAGNNRVFDRLKAGHGCHTTTLKRATVFLNWHADRAWWPADVPWPLRREAPE